MQEAQRQPVRDGNARYQQRLAQQLLSAMDYESAIEFCQQNAWNGVLIALQALGQKHITLAH